MEAEKGVQDLMILAQIVGGLGAQQLLDEQHSQAAVELLEHLQALLPKLSQYAPFAEDCKADQLLRSLNKSVTEAGRSLTTCFVSRRNIVVDHEVAKCVLFFTLEIREFLSKVFSMLGSNHWEENFQPGSTCEDTESTKSSSRPRLPFDLDGFQIYRKFSRTMDCIWKLATSETADESHVKLSDMDWELECLVEACQAAAEVLDHNLKALEATVALLKSDIASTAGDIEQALLSGKGAPPFATMCDMRHQLLQVLVCPAAGRVSETALSPCTSGEVASSTDTCLPHELGNESKRPDLSELQGVVPDSVAGSRVKPGRSGPSLQKDSLREDGDGTGGATSTDDSFQEDVKAVKSKLLATNGPMLVAISGKDGVGKTSVAALAAYSGEVMDHFLGGTYWVTLGRFPDLVNLQRKLYEDITGSKELFSSVEDGLAALVKQLGVRLPSLLVIDDVSDGEHLGAFSVFLDAMRGKYLVTLQDSILLGGANKDEVLLQPRGEKHAVDIFCSVLGSSGIKSPLSSDVQILGYVKLCKGVPLLLHALSSSFCDERSVQKYYKLTEMVETCKPEGARAAADNTLFSEASHRQQNEARLLDACSNLSGAEVKVPGPLEEEEQEGAIYKSELKLPSTSPPEERKAVAARKTHYDLVPSGLQGLRERLSKHFVKKKGFTSNRQHDRCHLDKTDYLGLGSGHGGAVSSMLVPLLPSLDSLSALHPVLLHRYLDLAAFPKGEYISTRRIENMWGTGRVLNHNYTLFVLGLFASRAMVEWKLGAEEPELYLEKSTRPFCWKMPGLFHDLADLVIDAENQLIVDLHSPTKTEGEGVDRDIVQNQEPSGIELQSVPASSHPWPADFLANRCYSCGAKTVRTFDWEDICERILHSMDKEFGLRADNLTKDGLTGIERLPDEMTDISRRVPDSMVLGAVGYRKDADNFMVCPRFSQLRCRLFLPASMQHQVPSEWASAENVAQKLSLDRTNTTHFPDHSFSRLEIALLGNNTVLKRFPSDAFSRMCGLTILELTGCLELKSLPKSISSLQSLKVLDLTDCRSLQVLPISISHLENLRLLQLARCTSLGSLPQSVCSLTKLERLDVSGCSKLRYLPPSLGSLTALKCLYLKGCLSLRSLPNSISALNSIVVVDMTGCTSLEYSPSYLNQLRLLANFQKMCSMAVPPGLWKLENLEILQLGAITHLTFLPATIARLGHLRQLNLSGCRKLEYLPKELGSMPIENLDLSCTALRKLPDTIGDLSNLIHLSLRSCPRLLSVPVTISSLSKLRFLDLSHCWDLIVIPASFGEPNSFPELIELDTSGCSFKSLPEFSTGACAKLRKLNLSACVNLTSLPTSVGVLKSLDTLLLDGCRSLQSLKDTGLGELSSLTHLSLRNCTALTSLPGLELSKLSLKVLDVSGCPVAPFPEPLLAHARAGDLNLIRWGAIWRG